ncbi:MAG: hypothetical protein B1H11_02125 [Desulfobacteraceae bacterium 4484_190.1]|nr:MAG: hypothetical protein B1H11_02125 [Desulfobacteraceae bacterium 4484_190.1]
MRGILGTDIYAGLLLLFIILTSMLLVNTNEARKVVTIGKVESSLPKIQLPKGTAKGLPGGKAKNRITLSARKKGEEIRYFIDNRPVKYDDLAVTLKAGRVSSVRIRFDRRISYGDYLKILDLCKQAGITDIINVYTTNPEFRKSFVKSL